MDKTSEKGENINSKPSRSFQKEMDLGSRYDACVPEGVSPQLILKNNKLLLNTNYLNAL